MPCSSYYLFIYTIAFLSSCMTFSMAGNNDTDHLALLEIKAKINDPLGAMNSWNDSLHFCNWYGVTCSRTYQRVISLDLHSLGISGLLSPFIGNLTFLRDIQIQNNSFSGIIPPEIGLLHRLQHLWMNNNFFGSEIPSSISGCSELIEFSAKHNNLVGSIPHQMYSLLHLEFISLGNNNLTGNIPSSIGNLSSLSTLSIPFANLVGSIPSSFGRLKNLTFLALAQNMLSGLVPHSIFNLSGLTVLDLGENDLEGNLPLDIGATLSLLTDLTIANNKFSGVIPTSLSNLSGLSILQLTSNNLRGEVPSLINLVNLTIFNVGDNPLGNGQTDDLGFVSSLRNATRLYIFDIHQNNFSGSFPRIVCNFSSLTFLVLHTNKLTGQIPNCIHNLAKLEFFSIMKNQMSGVIPCDIGKLRQLNTLNLYNNQLSGYIPSSVGNLTNLNILILGGNDLVGQIPSSIGNCTNLVGLDLSRNNLKGSIPKEIFSLSALSIGLYLYENHLTGHLDSNVGLLKNLVELRISNNRLSGEIPATLSACEELEIIYMAGNFFQEAISNPLQTLMSLQELDLSRNNLSGGIPGFLVSLPLRYLNLSYNNFQGEVPAGGVFSNATGISTVGNDMLCGGIPELELPKCTFRKALGKISDHRKNLIMALIFGFLGIILLVTFASLGTVWYRKRSRKLATAEVTIKSLSNISYQNLLKATDGFSSENLIGQGTFGIVYKGILETENTLVAIKVFNLENHGAYKSFMVECGVLRNIRHRNLVKVITACSSIDYQAKDFKALVYEYMVNGSLEDWLHPVAHHQSLNFRQRLNIAVDVAFAMEYLHYGCGESIVHCDLKPSNILLDEDMVALVGDFGLAKFLSASRAFHSSSLGTACSSIDYQAKDFKALVYEYMVNGSLEDWLHPVAHHQSLNFRQRLNIAVDVAFAMEYLHYGCGESIVHCDLKPSNILLDEDMVARVGDFGLAKFLSASPAFHSSSLGVRGTVGYAPPEYGLGNEVSTSGDVYSFGILLMEMITGKRPTTVSVFKDGLNLHNFVQAALPEKVTAILDDNLVADEINEDTENSRMMLDASISILGVALSCSAELPHERLDIREVASELSAIRNKLYHKRG